MRRSLLPLLLLALPLADAAAQRSPAPAAPSTNGTLTPVGVARTAFDNAQSAVDAAREVVRVTRAVAGETVVALRGAGYDAQGAMRAATEALGVAADNALPLLVNAGYPPSEAGAAARGLVRDVKRTATAMRDAGVERTVAVAVLVATEFADGDVVDAIVGKAYGIGAGIAANNLKAAGNTAESAAAVLKGAGYVNGEIAQALLSAGYSVQETARGLKSLGLSMQETADALDEVNAELDEIVAAMVSEYGVGALVIAHWLMGAQTSIDRSATALRRAGFTLEVTAAALHAAGYSMVGIGNALVAFGDGVDAVADGLQAAGATFTQLAEYWYARGRSADQAVQELKAAGADLEGTIGAIRAAFGKSLEEAFVIAAVYFEKSLYPNVLKKLGVLSPDAARLLKSAGLSASETMAALKDTWNVNPSTAVGHLKEAGYSAAQAGQAMVAQNESANDVVNALIAAGYGAAEVASAVAELFNLSVAVVQTMINAIMP